MVETVLPVYFHPSSEQKGTLLRRPAADNTAVLETTRSVLTAVREEGDAAVFRLTKQFTNVSLDQLEVSETEKQEAGAAVPEDLKAAIRTAARNIEQFHRLQLPTREAADIGPGIRCWRKAVPIQKVGLYIPGGTAPLFSTVLMLGIPARLAGCPEVVLCTPAGPDGKVHPAILWTAGEIGIRQIYKVGGAQAIAALAYGTETIPPVFKIFGPGNQYVTAAKQLVQLEGIAIDMPAGPSEVCIWADETADPRFVAADLLSQAEHGGDSQVLLISTSETVVEKCRQEVAKQLAILPRKGLATAALEKSRAIVVPDAATALDWINEYAAEHLILCCRDAEMWADKITQAGSVFIGHYSPESAGDYASGTNHTLPTNGAARAYSGVSIDSFLKKITYQQLSEPGLAALAPAIITMAEAEGLQAHAEAVRIRLSN